MTQFLIEYGIGGGYNVHETEEVEADNLDEALEIAYESALQLFDSFGVYERQNGEEYDDEDDFQAAYMEEAERWIDYNAQVI